MQRSRRIFSTRSGWKPRRSTGAPRAVDPVDLKPNDFAPSASQQLEDDEADAAPSARRSARPPAAYDLRRRLEDLQLVDAQHRVELQPGMLHQRHRACRASRWTGCRLAAASSHAGVGARPGKVESFRYSAIRLAFAIRSRIEPERLAGVGERVARDGGEGRVAPHQAAQPGVLELLGAPEQRELRALARPAGSRSAAATECTSHSVPYAS